MIKGTWTHEFDDRMFIDVEGVRRPGSIRALVAGQPVSGIYTSGLSKRPKRLIVFNTNAKVGFHRRQERVAVGPGGVIEISKGGYKPYYVNAKEVQARDRNSTCDGRDAKHCR